MFRFLCVASLVVLATVASAQIETDQKALERYQKLYASYQEVFKDFKAAQTEFEVLKEDNAEKLDPSIVHALIGKFKLLKERFARSRSSFDNFVIGYIQHVNIIFRVGFEHARISHNVYAKVIDQMLFEVLGKHGGITEFKKEEVSGQLQSVFDLSQMKLDKIKDVMLDIQTRVEKVQSEDNFKNLLNELQVLNDLNKLIASLKEMRSQTGMSYLNEQGRLQNEGKELHMLQKADMDIFLSLCIWFEGYAGHFQNLLQKIVGSNPATFMFI